MVSGDLAPQAESLRAVRPSFLRARKTPEVQHLAPHPTPPPRPFSIPGPARPPSREAASGFCFAEPQPTEICPFTFSVSARRQDAAGTQQMWEPQCETAELVLEGVCPWRLVGGSSAGWGPASHQVGAPPPVMMGPCGNLCPVPSVPHVHPPTSSQQWPLRVASQGVRFGGCFCPRVPHRSVVRASGWKMRCPSLA